MTLRTAALGVAAETRPSRTVLDVLGPPPESDGERHAWRHAAAVVEAYRDRWNLPDDAAGLRLGKSDGRSPAERVEAQRALAACRAVTSGPRLGRGLEVGG
jgi:hypothetical protein